MSPGCYFQKAANTTFHDLTKAKLLPPAIVSLLGLNLKFIPTPRYPPSLFEMAPLFDRLLASFQENESVIIASADKNLGPVGVDTEDYIKMGLDHLLDPLTYTLLTKEQAAEDIDKLREDIFSWTISHCQSLLDDAVNFIRKHLEDSAKDPLGYFYLLIKLHKQPISGCPVCSDCGSLPHALGRWVDETLQPNVKDQALYLKNSAALKEELERMEMSPNASLFTYNAVAI